jgi:hypothetical protein
MVDHAGHAIVVGSVVKLECVITAIDANNTHFKTVTVAPSFPAPNLIPSASNPQVPAFYIFDGTQLTWVSG